MDLQLKDKTALVTGASVGIGRGIAKALAAEGVKLAISARRADKLQEVADEIVAAGGHRPVIIESDLYPEDAAAKLTAAAIQGLGHGCFSLQWGFPRRSARPPQGLPFQGGFPPHPLRSACSFPAMPQ